MPKWSNGSLMSDYHLWVPRPTSLPAQFMKVVEICGGVAPSSFFHDNAHISNLCRKAGYLVRQGRGCELTEKGRQYLASHPVEVNILPWFLNNSKLRYSTLRGSTKLAIDVALLVFKKDWQALHKFIRKAPYHTHIQW